METFLPYIGGIICLYYLLKLLNRNDDSEAEADETDLQCNEAVQPPLDTHGLMIKALSDIGCQPTTDEEGVISVTYQGENFLMQCNNTFVRIFDTGTRIKADDSNLPMLKDAVNDANLSFGPVTVFSSMDKQGDLYLYSIGDIVLHPALPHIESYVKAVLDAFFGAKEELRRCYQNLEAKQADASKNHPPVSVDVNDHTCWLN